MYKFNQKSTTLTSVLQIIKEKQKSNSIFPWQPVAPF